MKDTLQKLIVLQDRDTALAKTLRDLDHIPKEEANIERTLASNSLNFENLKAKSKKYEAERKDLELQVHSKKTQIAKYKQQQFETRKNEEFQALGNEILKAEEEITKIEDVEIELMEKYEASQKEVASESIKVKAYVDEAATRRASLKTKQDNLLKRKEDLTAEISNLEQDIPKPELDRYRRLLASKKDIAIAPIAHGNTCGACHMKITQQTVLAVKSDASLVACDECGRILYWQD